MGLSNDLVSQFAKIVNNEKKTKLPKLNMKFW